MYPIEESIGKLHSIQLISVATMTYEVEEEVWKKD